MLTQDWDYLDEYQARASETAIYPVPEDAPGYELAYPTFGLIGELGEFLNATSDNFALEAGDCLWYFAAIARARRQSMSEYYSIPIYQGRVELRTWVLAEAVKKVIRDKAKTERLATFDGEVRFLFSRLAAMVQSQYYTIQEIGDMNLAKLRDRKKRGVIEGNGDRR